MDNFKQSLAVEGKSYWVWGPLAFSSFYFLPLIFSFQHFTLFKLFAMSLIYIAFVFCYIKAVNARGEKALLPVFSIVVLATFGASITPGSQALFGFACYFCGFNFKRNKGLQGLTGVLLGIALSAYLFNLINLYYIAPALITSIGLYFMGRAERRERQHQLSEAKSQQQIEQLAMIAERERIARDIHDLAGHSLSSIALKAELAEKLIINDQIQNAQNEIQQVANLSRELLSDIRQAVTNMKQFHLDDQLNVLKNDLLQNGFQVSVNNHLNSASSSIQNTISMILTEATTNIMRHSKGNKVTINITEKEISISDNGKVNTFVKGNGLNGIKQRIEALGGELVVDHENGFKLAMTFKTELI
ncbi:sensor histidine kinase [Pseudoalteromonas sp. G4]|uniref:sensor histidine kinase n=1 Tax=Pseudoalteromonas sp. G4 TaxID=2992761 RepID=UPI00237E826F|nr:sensor histidine kinase [Pseudoalteromonas sp. G4]MDE3271897.1 sensor histidine kinase [Pseudoalteromonas sp. G4]